MHSPHRWSAWVAAPAWRSACQWCCRRAGWVCCSRSFSAGHRTGAWRRRTPHSPGAAAAWRPAAPPTRPLALRATVTDAVPLSSHCEPEGTQKENTCENRSRNSVQKGGENGVKIGRGNGVWTPKNLVPQESKCTRAYMLFGNPWSEGRQRDFMANSQFLILSKSGFLLVACTFCPNSHIFNKNSFLQLMLPVWQQCNTRRAITDCKCPVTKTNSKTWLCSSLHSESGITPWENTMCLFSET